MNKLKEKYKCSYTFIRFNCLKYDEGVTPFASLNFLLKFEIDSIKKHR